MTSADPALRAFIAQHEGVSLRLYKDQGGKVHIGIGHNLEDIGLTDAQVQRIFTDDLDAALADLKTFAWWIGLDHQRQIALTDFRFQVGPKTFRDFQGMLACLEKADYAGASQHLLASKYATQVPDRAKAVAKRLADGGA